jgi:hypothetical protein
METQGFRMLHRLLYANWEDPPEVMAFEAPYREILERTRSTLTRVLPGIESALADPAASPPAFWENCLALYLLAPALVNVALNYKVCVEQGLPLHPTYYFEVSEKNRFQASYSPAVTEAAQRFFLDSIATARSIFALGSDSVSRLDAFLGLLPEGVSEFIYTSTQDKYTWRASEPRKVLELSETIRKKVKPALVLGAAHGSIMSGLLAANLLDAPLYFIRFSMFKRNDQAPVIAPSDLAFLAAYRAGPVILFDEDVAKGTTLTKFTDFLRPFFQESYSAGVLRHAAAAHRPDFTGHVWYE